MRELLQGKLYKLGMDLNINNTNFYKGALVVYVEEDKRYANSHWVLLPNGQKGSVWSGHLEVICNIEHLALAEDIENKADYF